MQLVAIIVALLCVVSSVNAHMFLSSVFINGNKNTCVRPHPSNQYDYPLSDKVSKKINNNPDLICGWPPALANPAPNKCPIAAGTKIQMQWWHAVENDDVVDSSHKGPCSVYMAKLTNQNSGKGAVWFKIYEEGFNPSTGEWCTDRVRKDGPNKGRVDVTIPSNLAPGDYLMRGEFWALHEGYTQYGAQPYVGCLEVTISGNGNGVPTSALTNFETYYQPTDPGLYFDIYNNPRPSNYPIPGGRIATIGGSSSSSSTTGSNPTTSPNPTTTPTTSPTTSPNPTTPPNSGNSTCGKVCELGAVGCACSSGGFCDRTLKCEPTLKICLPLECNTGSERCICTQGGACDAGLKCYSNTCVKVNTEDALQADSASSLSFSLLAFAVLAFVALL